MLNKIPVVQVSDTRDDDSSSAVSYIILPDKEGTQIIMIGYDLL